MAFEKLPLSESTESQTRSNRSRASQRKGASGEREVLSAIRDIMVNVENEIVERGYTVEIRRSEQAIRRRLEKGKSREDISGVPMISIEVKRNEALNPARAWEQCVRQADKRLPVLFYKYNREPWTVRTWVALPNLRNEIVQYSVGDLTLPDFLSYFAKLYRDYLLSGLA